MTSDGQSGADIGEEDRPGSAVDAWGRPVFDPSKNVLDLVEAANRRQDDLREKESEYNKELRQMEAAHSREVGDLRHEYEAELRKAETARIDAIRAVDIAQVQRTADVQSQVASALAAQVTATAEAFRTAQQAAAQQQDLKLTTALQPLTDAIADLRRVQYEQAGGKAQVSESREVGSERREVRGEYRLNLGAVLGGVSVALVIIFGVIGVILAART
jgi:hypothetical protein